MTMPAIQFSPMGTALGGSTGQSLTGSIVSGTDCFSTIPPSNGLLLIPRMRTWEEWELASDLMVEVATSDQEVLATTYLTVAEYGAGSSIEEAVNDLLTSLSEYRESLEEREARLGASAVADLAKLRKILRRRSHRQG